MDMISDYEFLEELDLINLDEYIVEAEIPEFIARDVERFEQPLEDSIRKCCEDYSLEVPEGPLLKNRDNYPELIHSIKSMVGDDEVVTTNSLLYAVAIIVVGPLLAKIRISWHDVQFSRELFNYAEGWILLPPSMDSSFEAVNRYARGNGVPFVLDNVKLKNLSPVRKQSDMNVDLASKFRNLSEAASWTDRDWFTYDMHQFALILGIETFDFVKSKQFPFLFKWEGGCGGAPPWNNLLTAAGSIYRYRRGRARRGILGIMDDVNLLITGNRKPSDCWFARNLNLAMCNEERWLAVTKELEWRSSDARAAGLEPVTLEREVADEQLPTELIMKSATIYPDDVTTGIAISHLREKGYIMTETDLVSHHNSWLRTMAIWGHRPISEIENQIQIRKEDYKEAYLERLDVMTRQDHKMPKVYGKLLSIENPFEENALEIMSRYYKMRVEQNSIFTSFMYDDMIRIFKSSDIHDYYSRDSQTIRDRFAKNCESKFRPDQSKTHQLPDERRKMNAIESWLNSKPLTELLRGRLPTGIGPDDARIARDVQTSLALDLENNTQGFLYLIFTDDKKMVQSVQNMADNLLLEHSPAQARVVSLNTNDLLRWLITPQVTRRLSIQDRWVGGTIPNPYSNDEVIKFKPIDGVLIDALLKESRYLHSLSAKKFRMFFDYPNINRKMKRFQPARDIHGFQEFFGGFLRRSTLQATPGLASTSIKTLSKLADFSYGEKGRKGPFRNRETLKLYSAKRGIEILSSWR